MWQNAIVAEPHATGRPRLLGGHGNSILRDYQHRTVEAYLSGRDSSISARNVGGFALLVLAHEMFN